MTPKRRNSIIESTLGIPTFLFLPSSLSEPPSADGEVDKDANGRMYRWNNDDDDEEEEEEEEE